MVKKHNKTCAKQIIEIVVLTKHNTHHYVAHMKHHETH
jgi:hypothetical protein